MPYTVRELPSEEWDRLATLPIAKHQLSPDSAAVVVVEDGPTIVAAAGVLTVVHGEEFWVDPAHHANVAVIAGLLDGFFGMLRFHGIAQVFSVAPDERIAALLEQLGGQTVGTLYLIPVPQPEVQ